MTAAQHRLSPPSIPQPLAREPREIHVDLEAAATSWEIAPGRTVSAWGYEDSVPGPTIVAHVGDTLVAHLVNNLPEPTSIHWHGLRVPAPMDGTQLVRRLVQPGDSFDYASSCPTRARSGTTRMRTRRCRSSVGSTARSSSWAQTSRSSTRIASWSLTT
jgi:FtsP/CotA-like multicopper oxidase with cupredoxin domain